MVFTSNKMKLFLRSKIGCFKCGAGEEHIKVNSHPRCIVNLINIHGVVNVYSHKKDQTFVTTTGLTTYENNLNSVCYIN